MSFPQSTLYYWPSLFFPSVYEGSACMRIQMYVHTYSHMYDCRDRDGCCAVRVDGCLQDGERARCLISITVMTKTPSIACILVWGSGAD